MNSTELAFANLLTANNIKYQFEANTYVIDDSFKTRYQKYQTMKYTPDFEFIYNGHKFIVEVKGWSLYMDNKRTTYRLFDKYCLSKGITFIVVRAKGTIKQGNKNFYLYNKKAIEKNNIINFMKGVIDERL